MKHIKLFEYFNKFKYKIGDYVRFEEFPDDIFTISEIDTKMPDDIDVYHSEEDREFFGPPVPYKIVRFRPRDPDYWSWASEDSLTLLTPFEISTIKYNL